MLASALLTLVLAHAARAQVSTASLFPLGFEEDGLHGEAVGTGTDGTTYVLSGTFDTFSIPFTMTLVEDATHVSEVALIDSALLIEAECSLSSNQAACTQRIIDPSSTGALTLTGSLELTPVLVASGTANPITVTSQLTITGTAQASTSISNTISTLPATIPVSSGSGTTTGAPSTSPSASGASRNALVALGLGFPVALFVGLSGL